MLKWRVFFMEWESDLEIGCPTRCRVQRTGQRVNSTAEKPPQKSPRK